MTMDAVLGAAATLVAVMTCTSLVRWRQGRRARGTLRDVPTRLRRSDERFDASSRDPTDVIAVGDDERRCAEPHDAPEWFRNAFEHAPIGMALTGVDGEYFRVNGALTRILGRAEDELLGTSAIEFVHPADQVAARRALEQLVAGETGSSRQEHRLFHPDGRVVWVSSSASVVRDPSGTPLHVIAQFEDVTERKATGDRLARQAIADPLTGLPNRLLFVDLLSRMLADDDAAGHLAVLFLDLDHFKVVNDSLGHAAGDRLLVTVANRLRRTVRPSDTVARFGGDEFTILCAGVPDEAAAELLARRLAAAVARPVPLAEGEVHVTASIGIALSGDELGTPAALLRNADSAMYRAKEHGRARAELFRAGMHARAAHHRPTGRAAPAPAGAFAR